MRKNSFPNYVSRTGAQFEKTENFLKNTLVVDSTKTELKSVGVPLTYIGEDEYATSQDELHCFVIGDSGCGKTRRVILPTIRLMSKSGESMVVADPKGELYRTTANSLREKGYTVQVLNFRNPNRGNRWNPLALIDSYYHSGDAEKRDKSVMMLDDIVNVLQDGKDGKDPFWILSAGNVLRGIAFLILEYGNEGDLTFENIALAARKFGEQIDSPGAPMKRFIQSLPKSSPIVQNLSVIVTNAKDTRNCIMAEFETMISMYYSQESLMDLFAKSEIDVSELGKKPTALFFILPDDTEALYPIATVFVKQIYSMLVSLADSQKNGKLPNKVTFLLDEFANFAKMPSIESMLTAARSRGIRFVLVCQSMDQLTAKYEEHGRETLLANCRVWIYMSCRNLPFLERLEKLIGSYISPYTNETCPLISIGELQHFDKDKGQVLILNDRCKPMMGYLQDYSTYNLGDEESVVIEELPTPHEPIERKLFSLDKAIEQARKANASEITKQKAERKTEDDGLRASIFAKIAEKQAQNSDDDDGLPFGGNPFRASSSSISPFGMEELMSRIDERIAELEAQEREEHDEVGEVDFSKSAIDYFAEDKFVEGVQMCVKQLPANSISNKNNIAFLMRFGKVDPSKIETNLSLNIESLLKEGADSREPYSLTNLALYKIEKGEYDAAKELFSEIEHDDWEDICKFWYFSVFKEKNNHPEGALVCLVARHFGAQLPFMSDVENIERIAKASYTEFINLLSLQETVELSEDKKTETLSEEGKEKSQDANAEEDPFWKWMADHPQKDEQTETNRSDGKLLPGGLGDLFEALLDEDDDEDDDDEDEDDEGEEIELDFRAQLQKKIQAKLDAHKDEED